MSPEVFLAAGYAGLLTGGAFALEWLSAHTHRRALRYRTAGFAYDEAHDHWVCPEGEQLWPHEFDRERRLVRYRARAHVCNACPSKERCTDSDHGREIVRPLDPWPHSEAGRFHRVIALLLIALSILILAVSLVRHHALGEAAVLLARAHSHGARRPLAAPRSARPPGQLPRTRRLARAAPAGRDARLRAPRLMQTWTVVRFFHILGIVFFVGGQLMLVSVVAPVVRRHGDDRAMALVGRRFGLGSVVALGVAVATGVAMASHFSLWDSQILRAKLMVLALVGVLAALHVVSPQSRAVSYAVVAASLLVVWFGVKLTFG